VYIWICDGFDARGRLHWLLHLLITCHVELRCFAWLFVSHVSIRLCLVSFVLGGCCVYRLTLQMFLRADVLSCIKPGERFRSSTGSVVTGYGLMITRTGRISMCVSFGLSNRLKRNITFWWFVISELNVKLQRTLQKLCTILIDYGVDASNLTATINHGANVVVAFRLHLLDSFARLHYLAPCMVVVKEAGGTFLLDFEIWYFPINFLVEKLFSFQFRIGKMKFPIIVSPGKILRPPLEKSTISPLEKDPSKVHAWQISFTLALHQCYLTHAVQPRITWIRQLYINQL